MANDMIELDLKKLPRYVIDPDTEEKVPMDIDKCRQAIERVNKIRAGIASMSADLVDFYDNRMYMWLGLGKEESAKLLFGISGRYIRELASYYRKFQNAEVLSLGTGKLRLLSTLSDEQAAGLVKGSVVKLDNGEELTLDEVASAKISELEKKLRRAEQAKSKISTELEELKEESNAEIRELKKEVKDLQGIVDASPEDRKFFKRISQSREAKSKVLEASSLFHAGYTSLLQIETDDKSVLAAIEGSMISAAKYLLALEEQYGANLGFYREAITTMAGQK